MFRQTADSPRKNILFNVFAWPVGAIFSWLWAVSVSATSFKERYHPSFTENTRPAVCQVDASYVGSGHSTLGMMDVMIDDRQ